MMVLFVSLATAAQAVGQPIVPNDGQVFPANTTLVPGTYHLPTGLFIGASGITLDLNGATLIGSNFNNYGISCVGYSNVIIRGGTIRDYYYGIRVENGSGIQILNNDLSL